LGSAGFHPKFLLIFTEMITILKHDGEESDSTHASFSTGCQVNLAFTSPFFIEFMRFKIPLYL
jgi:hypothetical protein